MDKFTPFSNLFSNGQHILKLKESSIQFNQWYFDYDNTAFVVINTEKMYPNDAYPCWIRKKDQISLLSTTCPSDHQSGRDHLVLVHTVFSQTRPFLARDMGFKWLALHLEENKSTEPIWNRFRFISQEIVEVAIGYSVDDVDTSRIVRLDRCEFERLGLKFFRHVTWLHDRPCFPFDMYRIACKQSALSSLPLLHSPILPVAVDSCRLYVTLAAYIKNVSPFSINHTHMAYADLSLTNCLASNLKVELLSRVCPLEKGEIRLFWFVKDSVKRGTKRNSTGSEITEAGGGQGWHVSYRLNDGDSKTERKTIYVKKADSTLRGCDTLTGVIGQLRLRPLFKAVMLFE